METNCSPFLNLDCKVCELNSFKSSNVSLPTVWSSEIIGIAKSVQRLLLRRNSSKYLSLFSILSYTDPASKLFLFLSLDVRLTVDSVFDLVLANSFEVFWGLLRSSEVSGSQVHDLSYHRCLYLISFVVFCQYCFVDFSKVKAYLYQFYNVAKCY